MAAKAAAASLASVYDGRCSTMTADGPRCHCSKPGVFGYKDHAAWPRRLPDGSANATSAAEFVWFCTTHRFGQCYADAVGGGER
jgi:hypothetical protein